MPNSEIEPVKKETTGMEQLIKLEKERSAAWIKILSKIKDELRKGSEFDLGRVNNLENRIRKLEGDISKNKNVITTFEGMGEEEKIRFLSGLASVFPRLSIGIPENEEKFRKVEGEDLENIGLVSSLKDVRMNEIEQQVSELKESFESLGIDEIPKRTKELMKIFKDKSDVSKDELERTWFILEIAKLLPKDEMEIITPPERGLSNLMKNIAGIDDLDGHINKLDKRLSDLTTTTIPRISEERKQILLELADKAIIKELHSEGIALLKSGAYRDACECFDKILNINPKVKEAWLNKGVMLGKLGKIDEEIKCYDKAINIDKSYKNALYNKEIALKNSEKFNKK